MLKYTSNTPRAWRTFWQQSSFFPLGRPPPILLGPLIVPHSFRSDHVNHARYTRIRESARSLIMPHVLPSFLPFFLPLSVLAHVTRDFVTILTRVPRMRTTFINRMRLHWARRVALCARPTCERHALKWTPFFAIRIVLSYFYFMLYGEIFFTPVNERPYPTKFRWLKLCVTEN